MRDVRSLRAAVVGTGFIGVVHAEALRRLGVEITGVVGSSPERARAKAARLPLGEPYESFEAMLDDERVDVVHVTTPNHLHYPQAKAALAAGKHVVCEKPLALDAARARELLRLAEESGLVHCTNFNVRFYPQARQARALVAAGALGDVWHVHGAYLQDWLLLPTDWNWRLEPERGGELRAVADIGSHWLDLAQFVAGAPVSEVFADLATIIPVRRRPSGEVETFAGADAVEVPRVDAPITSEDLAHVLVRFDDGMRGAVVISQVSAGRKNSLRLELDGSAGALAWDSERPEELWLGHRERPNETLLRDPTLFAPDAAGHTGLPAGHAEGFADTFKGLYRAVYTAVAAGEMPAEPDFPTFSAGVRENAIGEAVARSAREGRWEEVRA
jgi:predicted dehydrogenase